MERQSCPQGLEFKIPSNKARLGLVHVSAIKRKFLNSTLGALGDHEMKHQKIAPLVSPNNRVDSGGEWPKCWVQQVGNAAAPITIVGYLRLYGNCETRVWTGAFVDRGGIATRSESVRVYAGENEWTEVASWAVKV